MILTVDSNQKKSYIFSKRHLIESLLSPEKWYGTEAGSQLSFYSGSQLSFLSQVVSFRSGIGQEVSFLPLKTIGRSSMPVPKAGYLRVSGQNKFLLFSIPPLGYSFTSNSIDKKKKASRKGIEYWGLALTYLTTKEKMREFFGGAGNPTVAKKPSTQEAN